METYSAPVSGDLRLTAAHIAQMPAEHQALYAARPAWAFAATAVAVFGSVLGCIALLMRKKWLLPAFVLSLIGIIVQDIGLFVLADAQAGWAGGGGGRGMLVVTVGLLVFTLKAVHRGWLF